MTSHRNLPRQLDGRDASAASVDDCRLYRCQAGYLYLDLGESPMMRRRAAGEYETFNVCVMENYLKPGMFVVDAGANKGYFTLIARNLVRSNGLVLSVEPEPGNARWLHEMVKANGFDNVQICESALTDFNGKAPLFLGEKSGWHSLVPGRRRFQRDVAIRGAVNCRTLDRLLQDRDLPPPDLLKIDVEGAELEVLAGARDVVAAGTAMVILLELHPHFGVDPAACAHLLTEWGFNLRSLRDANPARRISGALCATRGAVCG